ncbi:MAG: hypothetical protein GY750_05725 [Lentisphaerae bacterium]|nr:hypothetical protein [Lentisphaerota bacterium]MCP4100908.1 hypothetical protein [Lentisphaerota bacterium]
MASTKTELNFTQQMIEINAIDGDNKAITSFDAESSKIIQNAKILDVTTDDEVNIDTAKVKIEGSESVDVSSKKINNAATESFEASGDKEVILTCGSAKIQMSATGIKLSIGGSSIELLQTGVKIAGDMLNIDGKMTTVKGMTLKLDGTIITT